MGTYKIGQKVKISSENDNENYNEFRNQVLIIESISTNENDHPRYDESMEGEQLIDLKTLSGEDVPFSLYEYEIEHA